MDYYAIAYNDRDDKGFGVSPWVIDDFDSIDVAIDKKHELLNDGLKKVTVFLIGDRRPEIIDWEYVDKRKVG